MIVPAVNATGSSTLKYSFGSGTDTKYQFYYDGGTATSGYTLIHTNTKTSFPIGAAEPAWTYLNQSQTGRRINVEKDYIYIQFSKNDGTNLPFVSIQLDNVLAGTYDVTANMLPGDQCGYADLYLVSLADYNAALAAYQASSAYNANALTATAHAMSAAGHAVIYDALESKALNDLTENKNRVDSYQGAYSNPSIGRVTIEETGSYVLVIKSAGDSQAADKRYVRMKGLTMTPVSSGDSNDDEDDGPAVEGNGGFDGGDGKLPVNSEIAAEAAVQTISCTYAATDVVNGHDYIYLLFKGNTMLVYDLDTEELVDVKRDVFGTPRGIYIDENHIVWICGATNSIYRYDPINKTGGHLVIDLDLIPFEGSLNIHGITGDGNGHIYFGTYNRGHIGMYDTATGEFSKISDHLDATPETGKGADAQRAAYGGMILKDGYAYLGIDGNANSDDTTTHQIIKFDLSSRKIVDFVDVSAQLGSVVMLDHLNLVGDKYLFGSFSSTLNGTVIVDISGEDMKLVEIEGLTGIIGDVSDEIDGKVYYMGPGMDGLMAFDIASGTVTSTGISNSSYLKCFYGGTVTIDGLEGASLVTFGGAGAVDLVFYNPASGKTVTKENYTKGLGSGNSLQSIDISEDGKTIYVGAYGTNEVAIYDVENGKITKIFNTVDHQTDSIIEYEGKLYIGNYGGCSISVYDLETGRLSARLAKLESGTFYQNRIFSAAAGDGVVYFATTPGSNRRGGCLMWYNIAENRVYAAAGPNPEDVYYTPAGNLQTKGWYKATTGELADTELDTNGDGQITQADSMVDATTQRFNGVIQNQVINNIVYKDGYLIGATTRSGGSGASLTDASGKLLDENNAQLFVYDTKSMKLVACCDIAETINGLVPVVDGQKVPIAFIDAVAADPEVDGKFWGVVSDTLFSFHVDMATGAISNVKEELSMGKELYNHGSNTWYGRNILFDGDFMYVVFGSNGLYMIERENVNNRYLLLAADLDAKNFGMPKWLVQAADGNLYYIAIQPDLLVLNIANALNSIKDEHGITKVTSLIAALKPATEISLADEAAVVKARTEYEKLSDEIKATVDITKLTAAEAVIKPLREAADKEAVDAMIAKINAIGTVTLESETAITQARAAYDALTQGQQAKVTNYAVLTEAEATLAYLKIPAEDKAAAAAVDAQIEAIGTVDRYSDKTLDAIRAAYENLTSIQKSLVTKLDVLTSAEEAFEKLIAEITTLYDFDYVNTGLSFVGNSLYNQDGLIAHVNKHYNSGALNWNVKQLAYTSTKSTALTFNGSGYFQGRAVLGDWIAFTFKAPVASIYDLTIINPVSYCGAEEVALYILPADTQDIAGALTDANLVGRFSCYDKTVEEEKPSLKDLRTNRLGTWTAGDAEEYIIVFQCAKASEEALACYADRLAKDPENTRDYGSNVYFTELYMIVADKAVLAVQEKIDAIGTVTLTSEEAIKAARTAYDALSDGQKTSMDITALTDAEAKLAELKQAVIDKAAADAVIAKIDAIGTVTLESAEAIKAARTAFDALTADQKTLVTNLSVLTKAEANLETLLNAAEPPKTGDMVDITAIAAILLVSMLALITVVSSKCRKRVI